MPDSAQTQGRLPLVCRQAFPYPVTEGLPVNHALAVEYGPSNLSEAHHTVTGSHRAFKSRLRARCIRAQGGQKAAHIVGAMSAVRCPNDALYPVSLPASPGTGNDVTVYNADPGLCHTRRIWLVGAWHVARAGLLYLSYHMFRDEVEAAGERN